MKAEIVAATEEIKNEEELFVEYSGRGTWHTDRKIEFSAGILLIKGMITGCGIMQIYNVSGVLGGHSYNEEVKKQIKDTLNSYKKERSFCYKVGTFIATLGSMYYERLHDKMLDLGFKQIAEYKNWAHGGNSTQRLYIYNVDENEQNIEPKLP